jgi:two-component system, OmpR family, sensor kinase
MTRGADHPATAPLHEEPGDGRALPGLRRAARRTGRIMLPWRSLARGSLTARLVASLVLLVIVASAVVGLVTYTVLSRSLLANVDQQLQGATSRAYAACLEHTTPPPSSPGSPAPDSDDSQNCSAITGQAVGTFGARLKNGVFTEQQIVKGKSNLSAADKATLKAIPVYHQDPKGPRPGTPGYDPPAYTRDLHSIGGDYQLTAVRGDDGDVLFTGIPLNAMEHTLGAVEIAEAAVFGVVLLLIGGVGTGLVRLSTRPLRRVAATATMVAELPLDTGEVTLPPRVPDDDPRTEVGQVGAAFNRMLHHVESSLARRTASENRLRRFAADASHELRTPLAAIRGYAELALRNREPVPEDVTHALHRVEAESARMSVLVDELLLLARLDAGRPLAQDPVDLTRLAIDATSDARVAAPSHRWLLELPDAPLMVRGDESRLRQVLANLLGNAAKHTPADSTVTVGVTTAAYIPPGAGNGHTASLQAVQLSVTDDGPGIPPELLPELFERFVRGDSSRSHAAGSTGLGLAIVKAVVNAHQGTVAVTSRPGRTSFTIRLPRLPDPSDDAELPQQAVPDAAAAESSS